MMTITLPTLLRSVLMHFEKRQVVKTLFWLALVVSYLLAILPQDEVPKLTPFGDKSNHFLAFAVLTVLLLMAYRVKYFSAFGWMLSYGIFIEVSQLFTINRSSELLDVMADTIGIVIGIAVYKSIKKFYPVW